MGEVNVEHMLAYLETMTLKNYAFAFGLDIKICKKAMREVSEIFNESESNPLLFRKNIWGELHEIITQVKEQKKLDVKLNS